MPIVPTHEGHGGRASDRAILTVMAGPQVRTDIVDVYVFRRCDRRPGGTQTQFLQMRRRKGLMIGTWQPIMGHVQADETAVEAALREMAEETGFRPNHRNSALLGFWQLETVNTYFLAPDDCVMHSPCFAAEVTDQAEPVLDQAHDAHRWVRVDQVERLFLWPGQRAATERILRDLLPANSLLAPYLRIDLYGR